MWYDLTMSQTKIGAMKSAAKYAGLTFEQFKSLVGAGQKRCTRCKTWKQTSDFGNDSTRGDGKDSSCFKCRRVKVRVDRHGIPSAFKGRHHTPEAKAKIAAIHRGNKYRIGVKHTPETRLKMKANNNSVRGKDHYAWKDGAKQRNLNARRDARYQDWRTAVFTRDNFTCQKCGDARGGNLRAHHIKPFAQFPELRFEISNGLTLCNPCHDLVHFKADSTRNLRKLKRGERLWK